jgi:hypothetical protein
MSADSKNTNTTPDDIDLLLLIERCMLFFRKYKWAFIIAIVAGLSLGIFAYSALPKIYQSRLIIHSFTLTNQEQIQIMENWNALLKKKEYAVLAANLNCREHILSRVKQMKAEEIQKVFTSSNPHGFTIKVNVTDNAILDDLQNAIVYGFENSEYIKARLAVKRSNLKELIEKTSTEIQKLDSTKKLVENIIEGKGKSSSSLIIDGSSINRQLIEMNEKLLAYREELKFSNAVQVLQSFSKFRQPVDPKLLSWLVIGLLLFLPVAFVYALFSSIREKLKTRARSRNNV